MGIFGKFGPVFGSMPASGLGGMQVFLYSTIVVVGIKVLLRRLYLSEPVYPYRCAGHRIHGHCVDELVR